MTSLHHSERSEEFHAALCQVSDLRIPVSESSVSFLTGQVMIRVIGFSTLALRSAITFINSFTGFALLDINTYTYSSKPPALFFHYQKNIL